MFTGKHQCWSLFLINMQDWRPATLLKRDSNIGVSPTFAKFLRTPIFTEHIRWLLLEISHKLSLYCIWERWMVSFRGTYWLSSTYFILLRVFRFFLFLSFFFLIFLWILLLFSLEDTHREIAPSDKSPALRKSTIMNVWAVGTLNRIFIRGS